MGRRDLGVWRVCIWMGQTETAFLPASLDGSDRIWEFAGERRRFGWDGLRLDVCRRVWILRSKLGFCAPNLDLTFANRGAAAVENLERRRKFGFCVRNLDLTFGNWWVEVENLVLRVELLAGLRNQIKEGRKKM
jgi:hypothetical protein